MTESEVREQVQENESPIQSIVSPENLIHQNVESWDNVDVNKLEREVADNVIDAYTYPINHPYSGLIEDYAIDLFLENCTRIPIEHLNPVIFNGPEDAIVQGYWINHMTYDEAREMVYEWKDDISFFHEFEQEALEIVESAMINAQMADF